jgi:hypothetical protein
MTLAEMKKHNVTQEELEVISMYVDGLSDLDMGYDPETGDYTLFAVEFDGMFGRHWEYFKTEEEREARLQRHSQEQLDFLPTARKILAEREAEKRRIGRIKAEKRRALREAKTLGGQHPELADLLVQMRNERKTA